MKPVIIAGIIDDLTGDDLSQLNAILKAMGYSTAAEGDPLNPPKHPPVPPAPTPQP